MKIVMFDLPFVLMLKENARDKALEDWLAAVQAGRQAPYSPYTPRPDRPGGIALGNTMQVFIPGPSVAPPYHVDASGRVVELYFIRRVNPHREIVLFGEVPGDRTGRASFSSVECRIPLDYEAQPDNDLASWARIAVEAVNHLIQHYRVIANRPYVYPVTPSIIQLFHIGSVSTTGDTVWQQYATGSGALQMFGGTLPEDKDAQLRAAVGQTSPPEIKLVLDQQVRGYLELGEWRLAIIETAVLFETFLAYAIAEYLKDRGKSPIEIHAALHLPDGRPHEAEHLAKRVIRQISGFDFAATSEFQRWKEDVSRIRGLVVHGATFPVSENHAVKAFEAAHRAAICIKANIFK